MPTAGSIAGSSGDAGVEYQRAVAAYVVAHGLAAAPLLGFGVAAQHAIVKAVSLESDDPVDDIRVELQGALRVYVQAKRTLRKGRPFQQALHQWAKAAGSGLDPERDRLTIVGGSISSSIRTCQKVLNGLRATLPPTLTDEEVRALSYMTAQLGELSSSQIDLALRCGYIHELSVEEESLPGSREAIKLLSGIVSNSEVEAWHSLIAAAGRMARLRAGHDLPGWSRALKDAGVVVLSQGNSPAAQIERTDLALKRYCEALRFDAAQVDLRSLGAELPPIPRRNCDAKIRVSDPTNATQETHLIWALLRRRRVVVTGLPGSGKSSLLRVTAGDLASLEEGWLPLVASLKDVEASSKQYGFRRRLLNSALRDLFTTDLSLVHDEFERLLDEGRVTLLLDSLDETYEKRGSVVSELEKFLCTVPESVEVVLATRDVAYGQASTLGWANLRVGPPKDVHHTIRGVLQHAAEFQNIQGPLERQRWVSEREDWVGSVLGVNRPLSETPLIPMLMTLLTIDHPLADLPSTRAGVLKMIVESVVKRKEAKRDDPFSLGPLKGEAAATAALHVFETEAFQLLIHGGVCDMDVLRESVESAVANFWQLSPGNVLVVAADGLKFWDEAGFFVAAGSDQRFSPRVTLFAEIGAAMASVRLPEQDVGSWVLTMSKHQNHEGVVLAAGLSGRNAEAAAKVAIETGDRSLLHAVGQAWGQGARFSDATVSRVVACLIRDARELKREGWRSWVLALEMAQRNDALLLESALTSFPAEYQVVGTTLLALKTQSPEDLVRDAARLRCVLQIDQLPLLESRWPEGPGVKISALFDPALEQAVEGVVGALLGQDANVVALVREYVERGRGTIGGHERVLRLMAERGFVEEAMELRARDQEMWWRAAANLFDGERPEAEDLLGYIQELGPSETTPPRDRRLNELADFVETLHLNDLSSWSRRLASRGKEVVGLFADLGGFNKDALTRSARTVQARMTSLEEHGSAAFYSLFDLAKRRDLVWQFASDADSARGLLLDMLTWGRGNAWAAASALSETSLDSHHLDELRRLIRRGRSSSEHVRIAALTLCAIVEGPEPDIWVLDNDPVLRAVAAEVSPALVDGVRNPKLESLLLDSDGTVRRRSIEKISKADAVALFTPLLERVAAEPDPGWTCFSCHTVNEPGGSVCNGPDCRISSPTPSNDALALLNGSKVPARGIHVDFDAPKPR